MASKLLLLPNKEATGASDLGAGVVFTNTTRDWTDTPVLASDYETLPVVWTPYQLWKYLDEEAATVPAIAPANEAAFRANPLGVYVSPTIWFATQHSLLRKPKLVLYDLSGLDGASGYEAVGTSGAFGTVGLDRIFDSLATDLAELNVMVMPYIAANSRLYQSRGYTFFVPPLPFTSFTAVNDGHSAIDLETVEPADWIGGDCLVLRAVSTRNSNELLDAHLDDIPAGHPADATFHASTLVTTFMVDQMNDGVDRFERFGYHVCYAPQGSDMDWATTGIGYLDWTSTHRPAAVSLFNATIARVPEATGTVLSDGFIEVIGFGYNQTIRAAIEADLKAKVIDFFDL